MKKIFVVLLLVVIFTSACENEDVVCDDCDGLFSDDITMFIDAELVPCEEGSEAQCFYAQINDTIDEDAWEVWTKEICGFDFEPAYRYKLSVRRKKIDTDSEGNKIYKYCLIEIEEKIKVYL